MMRGSEWPVDSTFREAFCASEVFEASSMEGQGDVDPPFVASNLIEQLLLRGDGRDARLFQQRRRDLLHLTTKPSKCSPAR